MYEILDNRAILEISGEDATKFLHNLITNDLKKYDYCYSYSLNNQGRYLFDFFIFKVQETKFLIDINIKQSDSFKIYLLKYRLRSKVEIKDVSDIYRLVYSKEKLKFDCETIMSQKDPRFDKLGFRSIVKKEVLEPMEHIGSRTNDLYLNDKYNFTIIDGYEDLIYERSIPVEYGAEELNAVSFTKGCYIGQEVISRAKYQGVIRKKIFKLLAEEDISAIPKQTAIIGINSKIGATKIGVICSCYKNLAIALIRVEEYASLKDNIITVENIPVTVSIPVWRK